LLLQLEQRGDREAARRARFAKMWSDSVNKMRENSQVGYPQQPQILSSGTTRCRGKINSYSGKIDMNCQKN
jgi:hypothetical protein